MFRIGQVDFVWLTISVSRTVTHRHSAQQHYQSAVNVAFLKTVADSQRIGKGLERVRGELRLFEEFEKYLQTFPPPTLPILAEYTQPIYLRPVKPICLLPRIC